MNATTDPTRDIVFLIDVDNTLLDNDGVIADLHTHIEAELGEALAARYWAGLEALRDELGYVDYLGAVQRLRREMDPLQISDPRLLQIGRYMVDYPFADRLYPGALPALQYLQTTGSAVIVSDGDVVFQPRKVERSGLWGAVDGQVLIYVHKEHMLETIAQLYPARRYVMIDDKLRILAAMKAIWGARLTTVFVRQGHYALDTEAIAGFEPADITIERIADLSTLTWTH
ncbi:HAD family hydrolase [Variovorax sp. PAMC 28711]|uniref:HAD family hydrolase n=1 Tax=Variovorax sp. PAMC 28711 TaxID=1795631 RepID=UPI00078D464F|nr:HAD family hydrolase [Variovorax sp. PAMC 28711]AMM26413.1 haloacid dehalogenase [Variovorax sp. PAMC 28711]